MRTLFIGALAFNLVSCTNYPNVHPSVAQNHSRSGQSKVHAIKSTKPQTYSSTQYGKKTKARAKYTVAGTKAPVPPAQLNGVTGAVEPAVERAKASIAAMMPNPSSAEFYKLKRATKKVLDESVDTVCGYVKGKNASGEDTGELPFLYILRADRGGEAYLVDGTSYTAQTVHSVLCD